MSIDRAKLEEALTFFKLGHYLSTGQNDKLSTLIVNVLAAALNAAMLSAHGEYALLFTALLAVSVFNALLAALLVNHAVRSA